MLNSSSGLLVHFGADYSSQILEAMKIELIQTLTTTFEAHAQKVEGGAEYWLARDLQYLLGYSKWDNFVGVVSKAKTACELSGHKVSDHFADVGKTIQMPKGATKEVPDIMLTRYACYLIAQNGDPKKQEIAFAQTYFAIQTRRAEIIEQRLLEAERVSARKKTQRNGKGAVGCNLRAERKYREFCPHSEQGRSSTFWQKYTGNEGRVECTG